MEVEEASLVCPDISIQTLNRKRVRASRLLTRGTIWTDNRLFGPKIIPIDPPDRRRGFGGEYSHYIILNKWELRYGEPPPTPPNARQRVWGEYRVKPKVEARDQRLIEELPTRSHTFFHVPSLYPTSLLFHICSLSNKLGSTGKSLPHQHYRRTKSVQTKPPLSPLFTPTEIAHRSTMASLFSSTPTRPLILHSTNARVSIPVAASTTASPRKSRPRLKKSKQEPCRRLPQTNLRSSSSLDSCPLSLLALATMPTSRRSCLRRTTALMISSFRP